MKRHPVLISNQHFLYFRQSIEVELTDPWEEQFIDLRQDFECYFLYHRIRLPEVSMFLDEDKFQVSGYTNRRATKPLTLLCHVTHVLLAVLILFDPYGVVLMGVAMVATNS